MSQLALPTHHIYQNNARHIGLNIVQMLPKNANGPATRRKDVDLPSLKGLTIGGNLCTLIVVSPPESDSLRRTRPS